VCKLTCTSYLVEELNLWLMVWCAQVPDMPAPTMMTLGLAAARHA
jgi:hypothetical protein